MLQFSYSINLVYVIAVYTYIEIDTKTIHTCTFRHWDICTCTHQCQIMGLGQIGRGQIMGRVK